jgi:tRNA A37 threonylcarbamoyladenosine synthetase subunit TsaC/SUA5/YrdC
MAAERTTADPVPRRQLEDDVTATMNCIADGGVAILPLDVAYAIVGARPAAIRRIYDAKQRSYGKPCGMFGSATLSAEIHRMDAGRHEIVRFLQHDARLPFSVVAPFDPSHPLLAGADPFVLETSSKAGTLDMLINAGQFHDEMARQSAERGLGVFGSSANTSLAGSKYRLEDVDAPVRAAADISFDYGVSRYANEHGLSSSIIDFADFTVLRVGHRFDELSCALREQFGIVTRITADTVGARH